MPVFAEFFLIGHASLVLGQSLFVFFECAERFDVCAVGQCCKTGDPDIDADDGGGRVDRLFDFTFGQDRDEPLTTRLAHRDAAQGAEHIPAIAVSHPTELGQEDAAVALVEMVLFADRRPEAATGAFLFKPWEFGTTGKEVFKRSVQIHQCLLQLIGRGEFEPGCFGAIAPFGEPFRHLDVADVFAASFVVLDLDSQGFVVDKSARSREAAHITLLGTIWSQLKFECLKSFHGLNVS